MERELIECVATVEDVVNKREICKTIISLGRLLRDFPKKQKYEKREFTNVHDARVLDFLDKMDKAIFTVRSKFTVIKSFVENTKSLTNVLTLALVLRDAKKIMLREELDDDFKRPVSGIAAVNQENSKEERKPSPSITESPVSDSPLANMAMRLSTPPVKDRPRSPSSEDPSDDPSVPPEKVEERVNAALKNKKGTLRGKTLRPDEVPAQPSTTEAKPSPNLGDAVQSILSVQEDSLQLVLKDPNGIKVFRSYLKKEFAEDNLTFWDEVGKFRQLRTADKNFKKRSDEMYNMFIKDGAEMEVNLPHAIRRDVIAAFSKGEVTNTTFDYAQKSIFHLMENDSFRRFVKSEDYKQFNKSKGYQKVRSRESRRSQTHMSMNVVLNTLEEAD